MLDLSIIIVSYNTKEFLRECLESILKATPQINYEVIVVDNASSDGSAKEFQNSDIFKKNKNFKFIENKNNLGFSKANNIGVKASKDSTYKLFLNPDTVLRRDTLDHMFLFMEKNPKVGASTCKLVVDKNGKIDDATHRGFPIPWNAFTHFSGLSKLFPHSKFLNGYYLGWYDLDKTHQIDVLAGAFMFTRSKAGEEAGWWDEDYFFYGEDIDFCYVLKEKGWEIYYVPQVECFHYKGVSGGIKKESKGLTTATIETRRMVTKSRFSAMKIFYRKHYMKKYPTVLTWLVILSINIKLWYTLKRL